MPEFVGSSADNGGVAVTGQRDGEALRGVSNRAAADQPVALLGPYTIAAGPDPGCTDARVVERPAHDSDVAVRRQRGGEALRSLEMSNFY